MYAREMKDLVFLGKPVETGIKGKMGLFNKIKEGNMLQLKIRLVKVSCGTEVIHFYFPVQGLSAYTKQTSCFGLVPVGLFKSLKHCPGVVFLFVRQKRSSCFSDVLEFRRFVPSTFPPCRQLNYNLGKFSFDTINLKIASMIIVVLLK